MRPAAFSNGEVHSLRQCPDRAVRVISGSSRTTPNAAAPDITEAGDDAMREIATSSAPSTAVHIDDGHRWALATLTKEKLRLLGR
jgi:hypothetical protein